MVDKPELNDSLNKHPEAKEAKIDRVAAKSSVESSDDSNNILVSSISEKVNNLDDTVNSDNNEQITANRKFINKKSYSRSRIRNYNKRKVNNGDDDNIQVGETKVNAIE